MHRLRAARQRRLDRAPQEAVDNLPWVRWGYESEKEATDAANSVVLTSVDELVEPDRPESLPQPWYNRLIPRRYRQRPEVVACTPSNPPPSVFRGCSAEIICQSEGVCHLPFFRECKWQQSSSVAHFTMAV